VDKETDAEKPNYIAKSRSTQISGQTISLALFTGQQRGWLFFKSVLLNIIDNSYASICQDGRY